MDSIKNVNIMSLFNGEKYTYLVKEFGEEKIKERFQTIYEYLQSFIKQNNLTDKVYVCVELLEHMLVDYFVDIYRLKKFHHISKVNNNKIHAYTAYWLVKDSVLQIIPSSNEEQKLTAVNEWMAVSYLMSYLFGEEGTEIVITSKSHAALEEFKDNLLYSLRYRQCTPNMLETILIAFSAGKCWQHSLDCKKTI